MPLKRRAACRSLFRECSNGRSARRRLFAGAKRASFGTRQKSENETNSASAIPRDEAVLPGRRERPKSSSRRREFPRRNENGEVP